jgi:pyridinium-3,5-bisthiocarboxylic acid mononucleotide nickel chelatase
LVTTFARPLPKGWTGTIRSQGYGAGTRDLPDTANVLRLCLMELTEPDKEHEDVYQVECNLDNMPPELIGYATEKLFAAGCKDVWQEAITMKKNRLAIKLCALVEKNHLEEVLDIVASETSTGGLRYFLVQRLIAEKSASFVELPYGRVDLKGVKFSAMQKPRFTPEYESCRSLAILAKRPLQEVYRDVLMAVASLDEKILLGDEGKK